METETSSKPDTGSYAEEVRGRIQAALPYMQVREDPKLSKIAEYAKLAGVEPGDWY